MRLDACDYREGEIDALAAIHLSAQYQQNLARLIQVVVAPTLQAAQNLHHQVASTQLQHRILEPLTPKVATALASQQPNSEGLLYAKDTINSDWRWGGLQVECCP